MSAIFDNRFRQTLGEILRRAPRLRGGRYDAAARSRRRRRSESGTFSGHRAYSEGEDVRNIDWNVYARTDELFLKVLEDEDRIGLTLILDGSGSMLAEERWMGAARLAAILGGLALVQLDGLHLVWGPGQECILQGAAALGRYLEQIEGLTPVSVAPPGSSTASAQAPGYVDPTRLVNELLAHPIGRVCWVSDFAQPENFGKALAMLRKLGCRCEGWLPALPSDRVPTAEGYVRFADPETGREEILQVDGRLRRAMGEELERLARQQDAVFGTVGYRLRRFPVPTEGDFRVSSWSGDGAVYS